MYVCIARTHVLLVIITFRDLSTHFVTTALEGGVPNTKGIQQSHCTDPSDHRKTPSKRCVALGRLAVRGVGRRFDWVLFLRPLARLCFIPKAGRKEPPGRFGCDCCLVLPRFPNTGIRRSGLRSAKPSPGLIPILRTADRPSQLRLPINQSSKSQAP